MNKIRDSYVKDVAKYYKNVRAAKAIVSLSRLANGEEFINNFSLVDTLMTDIVSTLSDSNVKIGYKGTISGMNYMLNDMRDEICEKYNGKISDLRLPQCYSFGIQNKDEYNIANSITEMIRKYAQYELMKEWEIELLCSSMDLESRANICMDLVAGGWVSNTTILKPRQIPMRYPDDSFKKARLEKLCSYMQSEKNINKKLVEKFGVQSVALSQDEIDFSSPTTVEAAIASCKKNKKTWDYSSYLLDLMKSPRYQDKATLEQKSEDILNILSEVDIRYIDHYASFFELEYDPEVLLIIAGLLRDNWNSIKNNEYLRDRIYNHFINGQTKDNKDYQIRMEYAKKFLEIVNDEQTRQINEARDRKVAQEKLVRVLTRSLNKSLNVKVGNILNKDNKDDED